MICRWGRDSLGRDGNFGMTMTNGIPPMPLRGWIVPVGGSTPDRREAALRGIAFPSGASRDCVPKRRLGTTENWPQRRRTTPPLVRFVGMGEGEDDLADFNAKEYAKALAGEKIK